jgi:hypothetical protein
VALSLIHTLFIDESKIFNSANCISGMTSVEIYDLLYEKPSDILTCLLSTARTRINNGHPRLYITTVALLLKHCSTLGIGCFTPENIMFYNKVSNAIKSDKKC